MNPKAITTTQIYQYNLLQKADLSPYVFQYFSIIFLIPNPVRIAN